MPNAKHCSCDNCERKVCVSFNNKKGLTFCFGLVKKLLKPVDHYRYCIIQGKKRAVHELMDEELLVMQAGLSNLILEKKINTINKGKK